MTESMYILMAFHRGRYRLQSFSLVETALLTAPLLLAAIGLRVVWGHTLGKRKYVSPRFLVVMWELLALRMLWPVEIPSGWSIHNAVKWAEWTPYAASYTLSGPMAALEPLEQGAASPIMLLAERWPVLLWGVGAVCCGVFYLVSYYRQLRLLRGAVPLGPEEEVWWRQAGLGSGWVMLRRCDQLSSPVTYNRLLRPVVVLDPVTLCLPEQQRRLVLEHEKGHILWLDTAAKKLFVLLSCIYWFDPLAWLLALWANRDMELCCDARALRRLHFKTSEAEQDGKKQFAMLLLLLPEGEKGKKLGASGFSANVTEQRIRSILAFDSRKKTTFQMAAVFVGLLAALMLVFGTTMEYVSPYPNMIASSEILPTEEDEPLDEEEAAAVILAEESKRAVYEMVLADGTPSPAHAFFNGERCIYTSDDGGWKLEKGQKATITFKMICDQDGTNTEVGYYLNGVCGEEIVHGRMRGTVVVTFEPQETGNYQFYVKCRGIHIYIDKLKINI